MNIRHSLAELKDLPAMQSLYVNCIKSTCNGDYSPAEMKAWISGIENRERWQKLVEEQWVLLLWQEEELMGFTSLKSPNYIDFMYVSAKFQGRGIAKLLLNTLQAKAKEKDVIKLESDISITARPFFERQGFKVVRKNLNPKDGEVLINFRMEKYLN